ncbi:MAG: cupredoxin domain-containing protein [Euzebyales bacterium]|nr:cupredoxin domain-containing protein [Euzebyales bacterium]
MTARPIGTRQPDTTGDTPPVGDRWVTLQRSVATAMIAAFGFIMAFVARAFVPPLAVAGVLFAVPLALSGWRRRGPAIAIGVLAAIWLLFQVANAAMVVPDLADPADTAAFILTFAVIAVPVAGVVGLVGLLRRASGSVATRTLQTAGAAIVLAAGVGVVGGAIAGDAVAVVSDGPATVTLRDLEFQPADLQVPAGTSVTWEWADGEIEHDVVADGFASDLKAEGTFSHTFGTPGTYAYRCSIHPTMTGTVTAVAGDPAGPDSDS